MSELHRQYIKIWTKSTVNVTTSSTLIVAENVRRKYLLITNSSDKPIWLWFYDPAVVDCGIQLYDTGWSYEVDHKNLWTGAIYGIHNATGNKKILVVEGF